MFPLFNRFVYENDLHLSDMIKLSGDTITYCSVNWLHQSWLDHFKFSQFIDNSIEDIFVADHLL